MADVTLERTVVDPEAVGVDPGRVAELVERCRREVDAGLLPSCQVALAREGRLVLSATLGDAAPAARYVIFSCTKGVMAGAVWRLVSEGRLDPAVRVAELIPEFGTNGKDAVTVEQLLTHTSGFPFAPFAIGDWDDPGTRRARFASWRLAWEPGSRFEYHPVAAHWVVADVIETVTGTDFRRFVREQVTDPSGLERLRVGVPPEEQGDVRDVVLCGEPPDPAALEAATGMANLPVSVETGSLVAANDPAFRAVGVPGGGGVSDAADLALYYQALLHDPAGLWDPDVLADGTGRIRVTFPDYLGSASNRTLGVVRAGDDGDAHLRGFGHTVSGRAFGHDGAGGQVAWADPESGLSFAYLTDGLDLDVLRQWRRVAGVASRAGLCTTRP